MTNSTPILSVAVAGRAAIIKVSGRANFTTSVSFKRLVGELRERGLESILLDLTECVTMDSTFLGVLAGTALKLAETPAAAQNGAEPGAPEPGKLRLLNPNQRVVELLDSLGVSDLFRILQCPPPGADSPYEPTPEGATPSREELSKTCLEAHRLLMDLNPENIPKFKEVAEFLAEDVKKICGEHADSPNPAGPGPDEPVACK